MLSKVMLWLYVHVPGPQCVSCVQLKTRNPVWDLPMITVTCQAFLTVTCFDPFSFIRIISAFTTFCPTLKLKQRNSLKLLGWLFDPILYALLYFKCANPPYLNAWCSFSLIWDLGLNAVWLMCGNDHSAMFNMPSKMAKMFLVMIIILNMICLESIQRWNMKFSYLPIIKLGERTFSCRKLHQKKMKNAFLYFVSSWGSQSCYQIVEFTQNFSREWDQSWNVLTIEQINSTIL